MRTWLTVCVAPRSYWIQAPSPQPDQRVARLLSTVFAGKFPSFVLATTADAPGVTSTKDPDGVAVGVGVGNTTGDVGVGVAVGRAATVGVGVGVGTGAPVSVPPQISREPLVDVTPAAKLSMDIEGTRSW